MTNPPQSHGLAFDLVQIWHEGDAREAGRKVPFEPGLNLIVGEISTGKSTFVRLLKGLLGDMPQHLPPEVQFIKSLEADVRLAGRMWTLNRPMGPGWGGAVGVGETDERDERGFDDFHLPVRGGGADYSTFLLSRLGLPAVEVPARDLRRGRSTDPVTMNNWLNYCVVTDIEIDTEVFGHRSRNDMRRWVFEVVYGYYNPGLVDLQTRRRKIGQRLSLLRHDEETFEAVLKGTRLGEVSDPVVYESLLAEVVSRRDRLRSSRQRLRLLADEVPGTENVRAQLMAERAGRTELESETMMLEKQLQDLSDLHKQLEGQHKKLTRAIVAGEWFVDFDFVVCPRCGESIERGRAEGSHCYLCLQESAPPPTPEQLLSEQNRLNTQIQETVEVRHFREARLIELRERVAALDQSIAVRARELDRLSRAFVSDNAERIERLATDEAKVESELQTLREYRTIVERREQRRLERRALEREKLEIDGRLQRIGRDRAVADANVAALATRLLDYLRRLRIPTFGQDLTVRFDSKSYLPIVSGRSFDELSSQGLKTLVNIAHALAHHTVAIDRGLPLPGLLILDGVSSNAGHDGYDRDSIKHVYRLLSEVGVEYGNRLQVIAVDNELPSELRAETDLPVRMTLRQDDRLIKVPEALPGL